MRNHFTISEFAKLRNININSLRYYEKIGLLKPAFIDPHTGYRYYTAEQLAVLDVILLCIDLRIPLKDLSQYVDKNGMLHSGRLFEDGKRLAQRQIHEIQMGLNKIEYALRMLRDSKEYADKRGIYRRVIGKRRFFLSEYAGAPEDTARLEAEFSKLYFSAQADELSPIFPAGLLLQCAANDIRFFLFCEIADQETIHQDIVEIPGREFQCLQLSPPPANELPKLVKKHFGGRMDMTVIVTNMLTEKYSINSRYSEIQATSGLLL